MQTGIMVVSGVAFALVVFVLVGGPMIVVDWSRRRRRMAIERQIALTDALDGRLGSMVSPAFKRLRCASSFGRYSIIKSLYL